jgi:hypothetical protein
MSSKPMTIKEAWAKIREDAKERNKKAPPGPVTKIVILHESILHSVVKDVGSLGGLAALVYGNARYLSNSGWVNCFCVILMLAFMTARGKRNMENHAHTPAEAWAWMEKNVPRPLKRID